MNGKKKYFLIGKWTFIYLKDSSLIKVDLKKMDDYWILFLGKFIISNDIVKLNKDWNNL